MKINKYLKTFVLVTLFCNGLLYSQTISKQVISSAGQTNTVSNIQLAWTMGEPVVGLMSSGSNQLGNGYFPSLDLTLLSTTNPELNPEIVIYPNPTTHFVKISAPENQKFNVLLFDVSGKLLLEKKCTANENIDVSSLAVGSYIFQVIETTSLKQNSYNLIKK